MLKLASRLGRRGMSSNNNNNTHSVGKRIATLSICGGALGGLYYYSQWEKEQTKKLEAQSDNKKERARRHFSKLENWDTGRDDFSLVNCRDVGGKRITNASFKGKWHLLYFGFTHCPDICPSELEKTTDVLTMLDETDNYSGIVPVFITIDPSRDTPEKIVEYLKDYHERYMALSGSEEEIIQAAKGFRVYFTKGPVDEASGDYILDHTLINYLISPDGKLCDYYATTKYKPSQLAELITKRVDDWNLLHGETE